MHEMYTKPKQEKKKSTYSNNKHPETKEKKNQSFFSMTTEPTH